MKSEWLVGVELAEDSIKSEGLGFAEKHLYLMEKIGENSECFISGFKAYIDNYKHFQGMGDE